METNGQIQERYTQHIFDKLQVYMDKCSRYEDEIEELKNKIKTLTNI